MNTRLEIGNASGSRPAAASASFKIGTERPNSAIDEPPEPIQPSAMPAVRRTALGWPTPIHSGMCGFCTGLGFIVTPSKW